MGLALWIQIRIDHRHRGFERTESKVWGGEFVFTKVLSRTATQRIVLVDT